MPDQAPPLPLREVIVHGRLLVALEDAERVDFETRALLRLMDAAHLRRVQAEHLHARASGGYCPRSRASTSSHTPCTSAHGVPSRASALASSTAALWCATSSP